MILKSRFLTAVCWDLVLQFRHGFYFAALFVGGLLILALSQLPPIGPDVSWVVPGLVVSNLTLGTFYFMSGLVLLEKGEGTLEALVVTPLSQGDYLASKVATLAALATVENVAIVAFLYGDRIGLGVLSLALGIALASTLFILVGFIAVIRYDSINEFLAPSVMYAALVSIPVFPWMMRWDHWLLYLHPMQAPMLLMQAGLTSIEPWQWAYSLVYGGLWVALGAVWSQRSFHRFVVASAGAS